ncbi:MAG: CYTH domain-containing protein [Lachnospiraceae bacterium]
MEIEKKYRIYTPRPDYTDFPCHQIEQAYLCTDPVIRIRREDDTYYLTYKSKGLLSREEANLPLTKESYDHLLVKADGIIIRKKRYLIPVDESSLTVELDIFEGDYEGLMLAEVEFDSEAEALSFKALDWFGEDVTFSGEFSNNRLSQERVNL